jgi:formamidopyrimidine-DNA glycosylase
MPEMPEVQAHAERMTAALQGARLDRFRLVNFASLKTFDPAPDHAVGSTVERVGRRGKYLLIEFSNGNTHVVHLMQGGRLRPDPKESAKPRGGLMRWTFAELPVDGPASWLLTEAGTERKAGLWVTAGDPATQAPLDHLAVEAADITREQLAACLAPHSRRLHGVLRDQRIVSGLGRMLTNEILFAARLSPFVNSSKLTPDELERLHAAIVSVCDDALTHERTLTDIGSSADRPSKVHNRSGEPCTECDDTIRRVDYRAYTVYYCPTHQTGGKILADNTTSKFLK